MLEVGTVIVEMVHKTWECPRARSGGERGGRYGGACGNSGHTCYCGVG